MKNRLGILLSRFIHVHWHLLGLAGLQIWIFGLLLRLIHVLNIWSWILFFFFYFWSFLLFLLLLLSSSVSFSSSWSSSWLWLLIDFHFSIIWILSQLKFKCFRYAKSFDIKFKNNSFWYHQNSKFKFNDGEQRIHQNFIQLYHERDTQRRNHFLKRAFWKGRNRT